MSWLIGILTAVGLFVVACLVLVAMATFAADYPIKLRTYDEPDLPSEPEATPAVRPEVAAAPEDAGAIRDTESELR